MMKDLHWRAFDSVLKAAVQQVWTEVMCFQLKGLMMSDLYLFTKLDENSFLTEDGFTIEIKELDGMVVWVSSSLCDYREPCNTIHLGFIESSRTDELGLIDLEVRELSSSNVLPDADGDIVEQLCARQTASFLRQLAELGVIDSTESMSEQLAINWQKEGF
jgi:hypothetical protein